MVDILRLLICSVTLRLSVEVLMAQVHFRTLREASLFPTPIIAHYPTHVTVHLVPKGIRNRIRSRKVMYVGQSTEKGQAWT
jgi:hypothetical protein